ncbi:MAG: non-canonical purine NTP pyrophosphatase [Limisphaerales bacterium]
MTTLLIATRNAHKVREIGQILGGDFRCLTLNDFPGAPAAIEDAETFAGNAKKKVASLAEWLTKSPEAMSVPAEEPFYIVADDSGLEVDALDGAPGVHSARFAVGAAPGVANSPDSANNAKLLRLLEGRPARERTARFRCVLAVLRLAFSLGSRRALPFSPNQIALLDGVCEGRISQSASGRGGFGYDPLFVPDGYAQSFAELGDEIKNKLSHRARALQKLKQFLGKGPG